jgi:predicted 3-demethylubiquinone-9 3-methyltransferase (glyoxalase superfamily)
LAPTDIIQGDAKMQKITPCLWCNDQAEKATCFYTAIFKHSNIGEITHYGEGSLRPKGSVLTVRFQLDGQEFLALNGGPQFTFTETVSFIVNCETQAELDRMWEKLSEGGEEVQCGWLKDQYGLSWQIVPIVLPTMLSDPNPARAERVLQAVMRMKKLDINALEEAVGPR